MESSTWKSVGQLETFVVLESLGFKLVVLGGGRVRLQANQNCPRHTVGDDLRDETH